MKKTFFISLLAIGCVQVVSQEALAQKGKKKKDKQEQEAQTKDKKGVLDSDKESETEFFLAEGMKFFIIEDYEKALQQFQKAELMTKSPTIQYKIAETLVKLNRSQEAETHIEEAIEKEKNNKYFYILLANIYTQNIKYDKAIIAYQNLVKLDDRYYYELAELLVKQNKNDDAIDAYNKLEEKYGINEQLTQRKQRIYNATGQTDKLLAEGKKLMENDPSQDKHAISYIELLLFYKKIPEAQTILERITQNPAVDVRAYLLLAQVYMEGKEDAKSIQLFKKAFQNPDFNAEDKVKFLTSFAQSNPQHNAQSLELAQIIAQVHPFNMQIHTLVGDLFLLQNNKKDALTNYMKSLKQDGNQLKVWNTALGLDSDLNLLDSLGKHAQKALEYFPNQAVFWLYNGNAYLQKKNYTSAIQAFEEGKALAFNNQELLGEFYTQLGTSYHAIKNYRQSDDNFTEALKITPNNPLILNNYAYFLALRKEKLDYALKLSGQLIEKHPDNATFLDTHGWVLYNAKEYKKAKKVFEQVVQKNNANGTYLEHYGDVLYQLGEKDSAVEQWLKAKKVGANTQFLDKKITERKLYE